MAFIGFGAKAGMVPLHIWMPSAYSAAPAHASALMASVMKKTAIYGILRVCVDLLGASVLWWGLLALFIGALSAILGVLFAMTERDIKRILAYSSVENVGIILLGIGTGMIGLATHQPTVGLLGFLAALYHALNHSFFKGLLFLGAGSIDYRLHTRNLNEMGGLARLMPWTGLMFLIGAMAVSAIPPFNGFVSEWFTYQAFFAASSGQNFGVRVLLPLTAALLALTGALAVMVAVKMYGGMFTGPARSEKASQASEVPGPMVSGMIFLALGCIALGVGAPVVAPYLSHVIATTLNVPILPVAIGTWIYPDGTAQAVLSIPFVALLLLGLLIIPMVLVALYGGNKAGGRVVNDPWACGYGYSSNMSISAGSFDQPIASTFSGIYLLRSMTQKPLDSIATLSRRTRDGIAYMEPMLENIIKQPIIKMVDYLGRQIQVLQMGDIRMYCLYIILTLAILLVVIFK
jgi:hydrogenase-4 component B